MPIPWASFEADPEAARDAFRLTAGFYLIRLVESSWARWVPLDGWLAVELTPHAFDRMHRHGCLGDQSAEIAEKRRQAAEPRD